MYQSIEKIIEYPVSTLSKEACITKILSWIQSSRIGRYFVCANPHSIETAQNDIGFDQALKNADLIVPDGIGMIIASALLGGNIRHRITGMDIFMGVNRELNKISGKVFFLGSTEENLVKIYQKMRQNFPNINVETFSPPFKSKFSEQDNELMIDRINKFQPDVLWVGMTAPKQEKWIFENKDRVNAKFIGPIGAVFDFYTGNVIRSHPVFQKMGLEWLPRLLKQPRRLYKRSLISAPKFFLRIINSSISKNKTA